MISSVLNPSLEVDNYIFTEKPNGNAGFRPNPWKFKPESAALFQAFSRKATYIDKIYEDKVHPSNILKNKQMYQNKIQRVARKVEVGRMLYQNSYKMREQTPEKSCDLHFVLSVYNLKSGKWIRTPIVATASEVLENPIRYTMISREQFDEFGQGLRPLRQAEWESLQISRPSLAEYPEMVSLLRAKRTECALSLLSAGDRASRAGTPGSEVQHIVEHLTNTRSRIYKSRPSTSESAFPSPSLSRPASSKPAGMPGADTRAGSQHVRLHRRIDSQKHRLDLWPPSRFDCGPPARFELDSSAAILPPAMDERGDDAAQPSYLPLGHAEPPRSPASPASSIWPSSASSS